MKSCYFTLLLFVAPFCYGQKIVDVQNSALKAPNGIKIDGKINEWESFAASNKRTELSYSIANDENNLYLVIKSNNTTTTTKILAGGISFTINTAGKKKIEDGFTLTYPIVSRANRNGGRGQRGSGFGQRAEQSQAQKDSVMLINRKSQLATAKEIKLIGFSTISDTLISIYNEYSIKVATSVDLTGIYNYELSIPLKYLNLTVVDGKELAYQIKLNGMAFSGFGGGGGNFGGGAGRGNGGNFGGGGGQDLLNPTDFWGKYVMFKN